MVTVDLVSMPNTEIVHRHRYLRTPGLSSAALFLGVAFLTRAIQFGNPVLQIDEQFYLLAGDRLLHGTLPFVDIWDRKPFGLFALYALIRLLGGTGVIQYQIVATLFAAATAFVISRMSLRLTNRKGAIVAGTVYLLFILSSGGDGGQAPVFYNLPVATAALIVLRVQEQAAFGAQSFRMACLAMIILGIAIQIKYSVIFEGAFFGIWLLRLAWSGGVRMPGILASALLWVGIALIPTVAVAALYWRLGFIDQFVFANFVSIFMRSPIHDLNLPTRLFIIAIHIALPAGIAIWGMTVQVPDRAARHFVGAWALAAIAAVLVFGTYHYHYALPLFAPLAAAGAPIYGDAAARLGPARAHLNVGTIVMLIGLLLGLGKMTATRASRGTGEAVHAAARLVGSTPGDCIFVFNGDPILYHLTNSCLPTVYSFPTFLSERQEASSIGVDQVRELHRTMSKRPSYVFTREPVPGQAQAAAWLYMRAVLQRDYRLAFRQQAGSSIMLGYARKGCAQGAGHDASKPAGTAQPRGAAAADGGAGRPVARRGRADDAAHSGRSL